MLVVIAVQTARLLGSVYGVWRNFIIIALRCFCGPEG